MVLESIIVSRRFSIITLEINNLLHYRASDFSREYDGACLQMRMSYSPAAHFFLFLVQWTDCHLAGALGLLRILIYKVLPFVLFDVIDHIITLSLECGCIISIMMLQYLERKFCCFNRFMLMEPPLCPHMREKQVLENSMVRFVIIVGLQFLFSC